DFAVVVLRQQQSTIVSADDTVAVVAFFLPEELPRLTGGDHAGNRVRLHIAHAGSRCGSATAARCSTSAASPCPSSTGGRRRLAHGGQGRVAGIGRRLHRGRGRARGLGWQLRNLTLREPDERTQYTDADGDDDSPLHECCPPRLLLLLHPCR